MPVSDDFSDGTLDPVWRIEGPSGVSATLGANVTDAWLALVSPDGDHDLWHVNNGTRAMQDTADTDLQLETRFLSTPRLKYQMQGILVEQDADNWLRFDTYSDGKRLYAFASATVDGRSSTKFQVAIPGNTAPYIKVTRVGDQWVMDYSTDGTTWVRAGSFSHALEVTASGVFAGNLGAAPGHTALVDYFENTAAPILDEDATLPVVQDPPVAGDDAFTTAQGAALTITTAQLLANDSDPDGDALTITAIGAPAHGTLVAQDGGYLYTPATGFSGTDSFTYTLSDGTRTDTAQVTITVGTPIALWNGEEQSFGAPGEAQTWINILGNISGEIASLSYRLNDGPERALSVGPDTRRLHDTGDFNIDIAYAALDGTARDDVVTIIARMADGQTHTRQVTVDYLAGNRWAPNYSIDWAEVTDLQTVAQVVDGRWQVSDLGLRPAATGYDRVVAIGDRHWDNYEARLSVSTHDLLNVDPSGRDGGGFAIGMLWNGHTDTPIKNWQPKSGWEPGAAFFYTDDNADGVGRLRLHPSVNFFNNLATKSMSLEEGMTYQLVVRVEQVGLYDRLYRLKIWEDGAPEPVNWTIQGVQKFAITQAPATGSMYLNAHYFDVTFGDVAVTEIRGRDILQGDARNEMMIAVDPDAIAPGLGEIDVFVGGAGADVFIFGDALRAYYDDGDAADSGLDDYGFVWDFRAGQDAVQLHGSASDYVLTTDATGLPAGTAIWLAGTTDELIGVLNGVYGLDLNGGEFRYSDQVLA